VIRPFSKGEKRGTQCTERLKYWEMSRLEKMDEQKQNKICGRKGFAFARLKIFEIRRVWISAPQEGAGGMRGGAFFLAERAFKFRKL
jgi:hypothetical protein